MEGYLKKWVNLIYHWQNRYFIIHEDSLIYCQNKGSPKKGQVHLSICSIRAVNNDPLRIVINYGMSEMHLRAASVQEKEKWLEALLLTQQRLSSVKSNGLLAQKKNNPFAFLNGAPTLDLKRIHSSLTQVWVQQAQLESELTNRSDDRISGIIRNLKDWITQCAQQIDEEYNKLLVIGSKLQEKIRENNDINPPDHEDLEEDTPTHNDYHSFQDQDDDEFMTINDEIYDERRTFRRLSTQQILKPMSISDLLEQIKSQTVKYKNMFGNDAFRDMILGVEESRDVLPSFKDPNEKIRLFSVIKDMAGQDLSKLTLPISFNEPLSLIQNLCETLEYSQILDQADMIEDSALRLAYVMVFAVSSLSSTIGRVKKPFNPILGETFEYTGSGFKFVGEQVSHHPPISVGFAENEHFEYLADNNVKTQFLGTCIEVTPQGWAFIKLKKHNDKILFQRCKSAAKNLILGTQYLDHFGEMKFRNESTSEVGTMKLTERGMLTGGAYQLAGSVQSKAGHKITISGKWDSQVIITNGTQQIPVWKRNPLPEQHEQQYYFTKFAIQLNHLNQQLLRSLPPTDSRLRPDQRAIENSNIEFASIEKTRLEQKQRAAKKELQEKKQEHQPRWFTKSNDKYIYKGDYWTAKESYQLDIF